MNSFLRAAELLHHRLGAVGILAMAILFGNIASWMLVVMPLQGDIREKSAELAWLHKQPKSNDVAVKPVLNDEQQLVQFYRQFPDASQLNTLLGQLHQLAIDNGIVLVTGEYKLGEYTLSGGLNNRKLVRYEIIFPIQANYAQLRAFIDAASQKFPTLGLGEINIKRESVNESGGQVRLNYVLLMSKSN